MREPAEEPEKEPPVRQKENQVSLVKKGVRDEMSTNTDDRSSNMRVRIEWGI